MIQKSFPIFGLIQIQEHRIQLCLKENHAWRGKSDFGEETAKSKK